ncbi:NAD(P)-binding protein [Penicillium herquei]|nr:NAD(P)-binding protein [Penicillium herquei]
MAIDGVALITGAGSGIGRDCGIAFAIEGARGIIFADIDLTAAQEALEESKAQATNAAYRGIAVQVDIADEESVRNMVDTALNEFGSIDYSINSAGIGVQQIRPVSETCMAEFDRMMSINVRGTMLCVRIVSEAMKLQPLRVVDGRTGPRGLGRGTIVNVASANAVVAFPGIVQYTAAKHAVLGITKTAALDNAPHGIRVNAICPSWVETPMIDKAFAGTPEVLSALASSIPAGRLARTEEISDVILFLSGPKSTYVTGVGFLVDGGTTLEMKHG